MYNHQVFYANCQPLDLVDTCNFDVTNQSLWKRMTPEAIKSIVIHPNICRPLPPLTPPTLDPILVANSLEIELRTLMTRQRKVKYSSWGEI